MKYHKSKYTPKNKEKYRGDFNNIIARSSWERRFFIWCDSTSSVLSWSSEETVINYICPTDGKPHRYFVDAKVTIKQTDGSVKTFLVEIKPFAQTLPPKPRKNKKTTLMETATWMKNTAKWEYAKKYCDKYGYEFMIITENELGLSK